MRMFKIVTATTDTGLRLWVAVDSIFKPDLLHDDDSNIVLTADAADEAEFDGLVDELINELVELKQAARLQFRF
jgi:hypothetical protein